MEQQWNKTMGKEKFFTFLDGKKQTVEKTAGVFYTENEEYIPASRCFSESDKVGYRDDTLWGENIHNPASVCFYETDELGNTDIPEYLLSNYRNVFDQREIQFLEGVVSEEYDDVDEKEFKSIISKVIGDRNYCLWLCERPEDVLEEYIIPFTDATLTETEIVSYRIPEDAIILADNGREGKLYVWFSFV